MELYAEFIKRYPHIKSTVDVNRIVDKAKYIYYASKFPYEATPEKDHPINSFMQLNAFWQIADELVDRLGFNSAIGYHENGVNWSFDEAWISKFTQRLLTPRVMTISRGRK